MENLNEILDVLDSRSKVLVGVLLKRIEILQEQGVLTPELYKSLVKESCYEEFRNIKAILTIGKVVFKARNSIKES